MSSLKPSVSQLYFHEIHGKNMELKNDRKMACRVKDLNHAVTFSHRPVKILEPIVFRVSKFSDIFTGGLKLGFTRNDPWKMKDTIKDYSNSVLEPKNGNWTQLFSKSINKREEYVISFHVDNEGSVYYSINQEVERFLFNGVDTSNSLWAVIEVAGTAIEVEFLGDGTVDKFALQEVYFHPNHGRHVSLTEDRTLAYKKRRAGHYAYVFSSRPFNVKEQFIVHIEELSKGFEATLEYGVISTDPSKIPAIDLPKNTSDLLDFPHHCIIHKDKNSYKTGDKLIFTISLEGKFFVLKNCSSKTCCFPINTSKPLWLFIKLSGAISEISIKNLLTKDYFNITMEQNFQKDPSPSNKNDCLSYATTSIENSPVGNKCLVCFDVPHNCAFYPCGHMYMCYECAQDEMLHKELVECPLCKAHVQELVKVYC